MFVEPVGKSAVLERLGRWPCFHDSEIRRLTFDGKSGALLLIELTPSDEGGTFPLKSAIEFRIDGIQMVKVYSFTPDGKGTTFALEAPPVYPVNAIIDGSQNVIFDLEFEPTENGARLTIEPVQGFMECTIEAGSIQAKLVTLA